MNDTTKSTLGGLSSLLGLIPGWGTAAAGIAGTAISLIPSPQTYRPIAENNALAKGGHLAPLSRTTSQVIASNPAATDSVELPQAMVDDGETITTLADNSQYVFSAKLNNPLSGNTFATDNKRLASGDRKAQMKPYDKEAANALMHNERSRATLVKLNEAIKGMEQLRTTTAKLAKGGYMKPKLAGGGDPWVNTPTLVPSNFRNKWGDNYFSMENGIDYLGNRIPGTDRKMINPAIQPTGLVQPAPLPAPQATTIGGAGIGGYNPFASVLSALNSGKNINMQNMVLPPNYADAPKLNPNQVDARQQQTALLSNPNSIVNRAQAPRDPLTSYDNTLADVRSIAQTNVPSPEDPREPGQSLLDNPMAYQFGELGAKAALLARGYDKQAYRQAGSPISLRGFSPDDALAQNEYTTNKARADLRQAPTAGGYLNNLQNVYNNKYRQDASTTAQYDNMNREAQVGYEGRLAQREAQNIQNGMQVDQIRQQDEAAYFNQLYDILSSVGNIGRAKADKQSNDSAVQMILSAYPDIGKYIGADLNVGKNKIKTKK